MGGKNYKVVEPKLDQKLDVAEKFEVWVGLWLFQAMQFRELSSN